MRQFVFLLLALQATALAAAGEPALPSGLTSFNQALAKATLAMDNAASLALWDNSGISLMPAAEPLVGKDAIARFLGEVTAGLPGAHMEKFELQCHLVAIHESLASEWCDEHQVVHFADKRPPFDGRGHMLLVLRRGTDHSWRILSEMWNQGITPKSD